MILYTCISTNKSFIYTYALHVCLGTHDDLLAFFILPLCIPKIIKSIKISTTDSISITRQQLSRTFILLVKVRKYFYKLNFANLPKVFTYLFNF